MSLIKPPGILKANLNHPYLRNAAWVQNWPSLENQVIQSGPITTGAGLGGGDNPGGSSPRGYGWGWGTTNSEALKYDSVPAGLMEVSKTDLWSVIIQQWKTNDPVSSPGVLWSTEFTESKAGQWQLSWGGAEPHLIWTGFQGGGAQAANFNNLDLPNGSHLVTYGVSGDSTRVDAFMRVDFGEVQKDNFVGDRSPDAGGTTGTLWQGGSFAFHSVRMAGAQFLVIVLVGTKLQDAEMESMILNPWQVFRKQERVVYAPPPKKTLTLEVPVRDWGVRKPPLGVRLNRRHALVSNKMFFAVAFQASGPTDAQVTGVNFPGARELINDVVPTTNQSSDPQSMDPSPYGPVYHQQVGVNDPNDVGFDYGDLAAWEPPVASNQVLLIARVKWDGATHTGNQRIISAAAASGADEWCIGLTSTSEFFMRSGSNGANDAISTFGPSTDTWYTVVGYQFGTAANNKLLEVYDEHGRQIQRVAASGDPIDAGPGVAIGYVLTQNRPWDGSIDYAYAWHNMGVSETRNTIDRIVQNPWQIFERRRIPIFLRPGRAVETKEPVWVRREWYRKPGASNPINPRFTGGLVEAVGFFDGQPRSMIDDVATVINSGDPKSEVVGGMLGRRYDGNDDDKFSDTTRHNNMLGALTIVLVVRSEVGPSDATVYGLFAKRDDLPDFSEFGCNFQNSASGFQFYWHDGSDFQLVTTTHVVPTDVVTTYLFTRPVAATSGKIFQNGVRIGSTSSLIAPVASTGPLSFGSSADDGEPFLGTEYLFGMWNYEFSEAAAKSMSINPWQFFEPRRVPVFPLRLVSAPAAVNKVATRIPVTYDIPGHQIVVPR